MSYYLTNIDFEQHNAEVKRIWDAYHAGSPIRVPVILGVNPRALLLNPELNPEGIDFRTYTENPDVMAEVQMRSQHYIRHNLLQDAEMGPPADGWVLFIDLQNYYEASWFGAEVEFRQGQVPDATPFLNDDNKRALFDQGIPDPFSGGCMARNWQYYEHFKSSLSGYSYAGVPAACVNPAGLGTDGPMTVACSLRGATEFCLDIYEDPDYARELLDYITTATIQRLKAYRKALDIDMKPKSWGFADDSIELLSVESYRELVLPFHKRLVAELAGDGPHWVHLCGNADRHLPVLKEELNVTTWDAGFPIDYAAMRRQLGPGFQIQTGPRVSTLLHGTSGDVDAECRRILESGITDGGRFILRDANNLCPCTPVENVAAMYRAAGKYGTY